MNQEIGRIVVKWAYLEHCVQRILWAIVFKGDPGRRLNLADYQFGSLVWRIGYRGDGKTEGPDAP
jgi:hypothetical protein